MMNKDILKYIEDNIIAIFDDIKEKYPEKLYNAMKYSTFTGGKRIRPYLMMLSADFLNIDREKVINQAVSLELIHTYSLIHDDLPSFDNDDYRRDKLTCHKVHGDAMATLAGDALLNLAYENLLKISLNDKELTRSCYYISINAGGQGMVGGQALEFSGLEVDISLYEKICALKTGALIINAVMTPAFIKASTEEFKALQIYGGCLGLIFQLIDDLLDIDKDKNSFVHFAGREIVMEKLKKLNKKAIECLKPFDERGEKLIKFCNFLTNRTI